MLPLAATYYVLRALFHWIDGILAERVAAITGRFIPGLGAIATVVVVLVTGVIATNFFGRRFIIWVEGLMARTPFVRSVYVTMKQITDAFVSPSQTAFKRVVMFQFPQNGTYAMGFMTGAAKGEVERLAGEPVVTVFMPTTPNPTTGFLFLIPVSQVVFLDTPVEEGLKMIISAGVITPPNLHAMAAPVLLLNGEPGPAPDNSAGPQSGPPNGPPAPPAGR